MSAKNTNNKTAATAKSTPKPSAKNEPFVFKKENYILLIASALVIVIGFIVMGSGKDKPFDDPMKITVAPIIVLIGFALGVVSIMYTPKSAKEQESAGNNND